MCTRRGIRQRLYEAPSGICGTLSILNLVHACQVIVILSSQHLPMHTEVKKKTISSFYFNLPITSAASFWCWSTFWEHRLLQRKRFARPTSLTLKERTCTPASGAPYIRQPTLIYFSRKREVHSFKEEEKFLFATTATASPLRLCRAYMNR